MTEPTKASKTTVIDDYLAEVPEPGRSTLQVLRERIHAAQPDLVEVISYGVPGFVSGKVRVAGFAAYAKHLSYIPHSGSLLSGFTDDLTQYKVTKGAFQFPLDEAPSAELVSRLVQARLAAG